MLEFFKSLCIFQFIAVSFDHVTFSSRRKEKENLKELILPSRRDNRTLSEFRWNIPSRKYVSRLQSVHWRPGPSGRQTRSWGCVWQDRTIEVSDSSFFEFYLSLSPFFFITPPLHSDSEAPETGILVVGHSPIRSHCSLIRLRRTARHARALLCAHSFART